MSVIRWIGRVLALLTVAFVLVFFFGEADFSQPLRLSAGEIISLLFFPLGLIGGNVLGWWREGLGALITLGSLCVFYALDLAFTGTFPSGSYFALLASPSLFYGLYWILSRARRAQAPA
ncbi:MAG: hypothetical protein JXA09_12810 [Anaerolineae bacterium]|nr:hypothetical protein [Anaerolineae bacterium]